MIFCEIAPSACSVMMSPLSKDLDVNRLLNVIHL
jgi:hypothetical protein